MLKPTPNPTAQRPAPKPLAPTAPRPWQPPQDFSRGVEVTEVSDTACGELWDLFNPAPPAQR